MPTAATAARWTMKRRECQEGWGKAVPDLLTPDLKVLFVGINPSTCSGAAGLHFASPGNRFWPTLHAAGLTDRQLRPDERQTLLDLGYGITNLVNRATARADQVTDDELRTGMRRLISLVSANRPRVVAILGRGAYEKAFAVRAAPLGQQESGLGKSALWVLPNPSGLNAHYTVARLADHYAALRDA